MVPASLLPVHAVYIMETSMLLRTIRNVNTEHNGRGSPPVLGRVWLPFDVKWEGSNQECGCGQKWGQNNRTGADGSDNFNGAFADAGHTPVG
jgi:hypothetical protein